MNYAVEQIRGFEADMGGNNEYGPLAWIFNTVPEYPRNVFLISDGGVDEADRLYNICRSNVHNSRLHAFGIGNGAEADIIRNLAKAGRGVSELVVEGESFQNKVINVLKKSIVPALSNWRITTDTDAIFAPSASHVPNLYAGESFALYALFNEAEVPESITMTCLNTKSLEEETYTVAIREDDEEPGDAVPKLWARQRLNHLEHLLKVDNQTDYKSEIQKISLEYQIPSSQTAFIASAKNTDAVTGELKFSKIPVTESSFARRGGYQP